jgi:hypothetical protein
MGENKPIREIETTIDEIEGLVINIGRVYENKVTKLLVDLSSILVEYPNATASLVVRQPNWQSYPATVTLNGMTLEWLITDAEIGLQSGTGEIQITVADGEQIYKSAIAQTVILPSILYKSGSIPDPIAHWISQAQAELEKTKEALNTAQNFIADLKQKLDNGELNGKPGPQGEKGEKGDPGKDGSPGATGATPRFTVTAVTGEAGTSASVTQSGTAENPMVEFTIPQGIKGNTGPQGPQGEKGDPGKDAPQEVVLYTAQTLDDAQKAQARENIGAADAVRQNILVGGETGNPIAVDDAFVAPLRGLTVYGKSTQDGTPTPDAPVPIVSVGDGGNVTVKVTGKNLLHLPDVSGTDRGVTVTVKNGLISISGTATERGYTSIPIPPFIIPGVVILSSSLTSPKVSLVTKTYRAVLYQNNATKMSDTAARLTFTVEKGQTYNLTGVKVQLELGTTATDYSPYREQLLTLPTPNGLPGIPVQAGGNYTDPQGQQWVCDEVDLERGVMVQRVNRLKLDDISWHHELTATNKNDAFVSSLPTSQQGITRGYTLCQYAVFNGVAYDIEMKESCRCYVWRNSATLQFKTGSGVNSVDALSEWLKARPDASISYCLAVPIETPLTPAELTAYKALTTYAPDTVVQASDGAGLKLGYQRDVSIVIKNLEDAIASMTTT